MCNPEKRAALLGDRQSPTDENYAGRSGPQQPTRGEAQCAAAMGRQGRSCSWPPNPRAGWIVKAGAQPVAPGPYGRTFYYLEAAPAAMVQGAWAMPGPGRARCTTTFHRRRRWPAHTKPRQDGRGEGAANRSCHFRSPLESGPASIAGDETRGLGAQAHGPPDTTQTGGTIMRIRHHHHRRGHSLVRGLSSFVGFLSQLFAPSLPPGPLANRPDSEGWKAYEKKFPKGPKARPSQAPPRTPPRSGPANCRGGKRLNGRAASPRRGHGRWGFLRRANVQCAMGR